MNDLGVAGVSQALLDDIVKGAQNEFDGALVGVLVGGSRVKGTARGNSDLDVHIIHMGEWYQKRFVGGSSNRDQVDIDFSVNPLRKIVPWILRFRGYSDFYATAKPCYPKPVTSDLEQILVLARRVRSAPATSGYESLDHYARYTNLRRASLRSQYASVWDRKLALATIIAGIAELRLVLAGCHHIRTDELMTQVKEIDARLSSRLQQALDMLDSDGTATIIAEALRELKPLNDYYACGKL